MNDNAIFPAIPSEDEIDSIEKRVSFYKTPGGYALSFYEYGNPEGIPLIFLHGTGSHIQGIYLHKAGISNGFRIIAPDRPGIGLSDYRKNWTPLEFAADISALSEYLNISKFGLMGISGAGPTLMATALIANEKLLFTVDLACAMPLYSDTNHIKELGAADRIYAKLGARLPLSLFSIPFYFLYLAASKLKKPSIFASMFNSSLCPSDKKIFANHEFQSLLIRDFQTLFKQGAKPAAYDALVCYRDWGFDISDVSAHIEIFHGSEDKFVPIKFSRYLESKTVSSNINLINGHGHFYTLVYSDEILRTIKSKYFS